MFSFINKTWITVIRKILFIWNNNRWYNWVIIMSIKHYMRRNSFAVIFMFNKNTLTGPANCTKTTRNYFHLSLYAKSRKTNDAKSRKWLKNLNLGKFLTIERSNIFKLHIFLKNTFHSNWREYLLLTSGQKPKKSFEPFLRKQSKCLILG